jgi:hypothetical protein
MNQMAHGLPVLLNVPQKDLEAKVKQLLPGYMAMGSTGMGEMMEMKMPLPPNVLPMMAGEGPYGPVGMGGMFTVLKVREHLGSDADPGWYSPPKGTVAYKRP